MDPTTEQLVTKEYLDVKLGEIRLEMAKLKAELLEQIMINQRWNVGLIVGLYATNVATLLAIVLKK